MLSLNVLSHERSPPRVEAEGRNSCCYERRWAQHLVPVLGSP